MYMGYLFFQVPFYTIKINISKKRKDNIFTNATKCFIINTETILECKELVFMGKKVAVNLRLDEDLKKGFDHVCSEMGITATAAITMFAAKTAKEQRIPFELTTYPSNEDALNRYMAYVNKVKEGQ